MAAAQLAVPIDGRHLAALRSQCGVTQQQLARRIGARSDELSRLERYLLPGGLLDTAAAELTRIAAEGQAQE